MLSYFDSITISTETDRNSAHGSQSRTISAKIIALSNVISAAAKAWKDVVTAIKSGSSTTITRTVRFGFTYFSQKSTVLKTINVPADRATEFTIERQFCPWFNVLQRFCLGSHRLSLLTKHEWKLSFSDNIKIW